MLGRVTKINEHSIRIAGLNGKIKTYPAKDSIVNWAGEFVTRHLIEFDLEDNKIVNYHYKREVTIDQLQAMHKAKDS